MLKCHDSVALASLAPASSLNHVFIFQDEENEAVFPKNLSEF